MQYIYYNVLPVPAPGQGSKIGESDSSKFSYDKYVYARSQGGMWWMYFQENQSTT